MKIGNMLIIAGILIIALGTWAISKGNELNDSKTIKDLKDSLNLKNEELQQKTDKVGELTNQVLNFSKELDSNTAEIAKIQKDIVKLSSNTNKTTNKVLELSKTLDSNTVNISRISTEISGIASKTNQLTNIILNEQREKGAIKFKVPNTRNFLLNLGGNIVAKSRKAFEEGFIIKFFNVGELPIYLQIDGDDLLVSAVLKDRKRNIILEMDNNEWALDKSSNFSINYDESALEIIDSRGLISLQIQLIGNQFIFKGIVFQYKTGVIIFTDKVASLMSYDSEDFEKKLFDEMIQTPRLFKHVGADYLGKRVTN
ncbi:MAG: hypothetical protein R2814_00240 [Flavobacteriaceae bacterium]